MESNQPAPALSAMPSPSPLLRAADPAFAALADVCSSLDNVINEYKALLALERERSARLESEIATLRAQLSARRAA